MRIETGLPKRYFYIIFEALTNSMNETLERIAVELKNSRSTIRKAALHSKVIR